MGTYLNRLRSDKCVNERYNGAEADQNQEQKQSQSRD